MLVLQTRSWAPPVHRDPPCRGRSLSDASVAAANLPPPRRAFTRASWHAAFRYPSQQSRVLKQPRPRVPCSRARSSRRKSRQTRPAHGAASTSPSSRASTRPPTPLNSEIGAQAGYSQPMGRGRPRRDRTALARRSRLPAALAAGSGAAGADRARPTRARPNRAGADRARPRTGQSSHVIALCVSHGGRLARPAERSTTRKERSPG